MKIAFRADASIQMGTGHVMRCLTLADELTRQGHECLFICRDHPGHLSDLVMRRGHDISILSSPIEKTLTRTNHFDVDYAQWLGVPWEEDAKQTLNALSTFKPERLVVDHYSLDIKWESSIKRACSNIMVIDDLGNRRHDCSLLLDQNSDATPQKYSRLVPGKCELLTGTRYALLRPEFEIFRKRSLERLRVANGGVLLIFMGGSDPNNYTGKILSKIADSKCVNFKKILVIVGPNFKNLNSVLKAAKVQKIECEVKQNITNMAEVLAEIDLAIGAAGSAAWERACLGVPSIQFVIADNQTAVAKSMSDAGAALAVDSVEDMLLLLSEARKWMFKVSQQSKNLVDGRGVFRVVDRLI